MKYSLRSLMTFSIRDLLWLMVVVALAVGWVMERNRAERLTIRVKEAAKAVELSKGAAAVSAQVVAKLKEKLINVEVRAEIAEARAEAWKRKVAESNAADQPPTRPIP